MTNDEAARASRLVIRAFVIDVLRVRRLNRAGFWFRHSDFQMGP
jgi:hypothetical protein